MRFGNCDSDEQQEGQGGLHEVSSHGTLYGNIQNCHSGGWMYNNSATSVTWGVFEESAKSVSILRILAGLSQRSISVSPSRPTYCLKINTLFVVKSQRSVHFESWQFPINGSRTIRPLT